MTTTLDIINAEYGGNPRAARDLQAAYDIEQRVYKSFSASGTTPPPVSGEVAEDLCKSRFDQYIKDNFPEIEPGFRPFGCDVMVQLKTIKERTKGGIVLVEETREFNNENTMVGRVIRHGPLAYRNRDTGQLWPEGVWAQPGEIVLVPKWGGFRFERTLPDGNKAKFCIFKDLEIRGGLNEYYEGLDEVM